MISGVVNFKAREFATSMSILALICAIACMQFYINARHDKVLPKLEITPEVPDKNLVKVSALGDEQFYFRILAMQLQNSGDSFGRFTALKNYDYKSLKKWFLLLDELDNNSNLIPSLAAYYYSNTQNIEDTRHLISYLEQHYESNPAKKWWWLSQAALMASYKLQDKPLALRLAFKLSATEQRIPSWAQQLPAIFAAEMGQKQLAFNIMKELAAKSEDYNEHDINYMNYFIRERLGFKEDDISSR